MDEVGVLYISGTILGAWSWIDRPNAYDVGAVQDLATWAEIALPDLKVTIVDSLNKRITFLNTLVETWGKGCLFDLHMKVETVIVTIF